MILVDWRNKYQKTFQGKMIERKWIVPSKKVWVFPAHKKIFQSIDSIINLALILPGVRREIKTDL